MKFFYIPTRSFYLFVLLMLFCKLNFAQSSLGLNVPLTPTSVSTDPSETKESLSDPSTWTEDVTKRTVYTSTYRTPEGQVVIRNGSRPINYYDERGLLRPIDPKLRASAEGWSAPDQPNPTYLFNDGSAAISIAKNVKMTFGKNCTINGTPLKKSCTLAGNTTTFSNIAPGIDKEYIFHENAIKYNYILHQQIQSTDGFLRITEEINFPEGCSLVPNKEKGKAENGGWSGDLSLLNANGDVVSTFLAPICYDASKNFSIASYVIRKEGVKNILEIVIPNSWINDQARTFPIVIDPLVTGPTSTWIGGSMPSCIVPVYNKDSILVTIPAGINITGLMVTSSYYADPFTTAVMSEGKMFFSTTCGISQTFTVPNPTGNTPGTAYLDSFDIHSPVLCCFPPSCTLRTFYLTMQLGRTGPSTGCNTTYIRYDPLTTLWPFSALVIGRTPEAYGNQWTVPLVPKCSNSCTITGTIYVHYGVPPFTITHPWMVGSWTGGNPNPCNNNNVTHTFTLTIPNCPAYCDTATHLLVPPPIVTDACGQTVSNLPTRSVPLKNAPSVTATPTSATVCSGDLAQINLTSCVNGDTLRWFGNSSSGTGNLSNTVINTGTSATVINYSSFTTNTGCYSDTITVPIIVDPLPLGNFNYSPVPPIANVPMSFTDASIAYAGTITTWSWSFGDNNGSTQQNPSHTYAVPGTYHVCLYIATSDGCLDSICQDILVIPADVVAPNVVTPNGDNRNDSLAFKYLEFYSDNHIQLFDRWGNLIYDKKGYKNDWVPSNYSDGTYYYVLDVVEAKKVYKGYFQIMH